MLWQSVEQGVPAADIIVLGTRHQDYLQRSPKDWLALARPGQLWVDANNILSDESITSLLQHGVEVIGIGKGHIPQLKAQCKSQLKSQPKQQPQQLTPGETP